MYNDVILMIYYINWIICCWIICCWIICCWIICCWIICCWIICCWIIIIKTVSQDSNIIPVSDCDSTDISIDTEIDNVTYKFITAIHINALCAHETERYVVWAGEVESEMECFVLYKKDGYYMCDDNTLVFDPVDGAEHENMMTLINMF